MKIQKKILDLTKIREFLKSRFQPKTQHPKPTSWQHIYVVDEVGVSSKPYASALNKHFLREALPFRAVPIALARDRIPSEFYRAYAIVTQMERENIPALIEFGRRRRKFHGVGDVWTEFNDNHLNRLPDHVPVVPYLDFVRGKRKKPRELMEQLYRERETRNMA